MAAPRQFEHYRHAPELFEVRRSWPRTLAAALLALGLAAAAVALVVLWGPVVDLLEPPGSARYRSPELAVLGGILLSLLLGALAVRSARSGSNRIVHRPTGLPVRRRFEVRLALPESAAEPLRAAIERGDARRWSPLPTISNVTSSAGSSFVIARRTTSICFSVVRRPTNTRRCASRGVRSAV